MTETTNGCIAGTCIIRIRNSYIDSDNIVDLEFSMPSLCMLNNMLFFFGLATTSSSAS